MMVHNDRSMMQAIIFLRECADVGIDPKLVLSAVGIPVGRPVLPETYFSIVSRGAIGKALKAKIWGAIQQLSTQLLKLEKKSRFVPNLKKQLACRMLERCRFIEGPPPSELCKLFRTCLEVSGYIGRAPVNPAARLRAIKYLADHPEPTVRALARYAKVRPATAEKWIKEGAGTMQADVDIFRELRGRLD
jgi:hypothetical protein